MNKDNWQTEIEEIESILKNNTLIAPIKLKNGGTIVNLEKFIHSHLETVKANNGNKVFLPYLNRLKEIIDKFDKTDAKIKEITTINPPTIQ